VLALRLAGKQIGIVLSGGNMDAVTLRRVLNEEI
jgi:threonine dehydratase